MQPAVIYPDSEKVVVDNLRAALALRPEPYLTGILVRTEVPLPRPNRFILVKRSGGTELHPTVELARIDIHCWSDTAFNAQATAQLSLALLKTFSGQETIQIRNVSTFLGPTPIPDPESNQPRYLFTVELAMRGTPL